MFSANVLGNLLGWSSSVEAFAINLFLKFVIENNPDFLEEILENHYSALSSEEMRHSWSWRHHWCWCIHERIVNATDHFIQYHQWGFGCQDLLETEIDSFLFNSSRNGFHFGHSAKLLWKKFLVARSTGCSGMCSNTRHGGAEGVLHDNILSLSQGRNRLSYLNEEKPMKRNMVEMSHLFSFWIHNCKNDTKDSFLDIFFCEWQNVLYRAYNCNFF